MRHGKRCNEETWGTGCGLHGPVRTRMTRVARRSAGYDTSPRDSSVSHVSSSGTLSVEASAADP